MMDEQASPRCLENRVSLKRVALMGLEELATAIGQNGWGRARLVLLTAAGVIKGAVDESGEEPAGMFKTVAEFAGPDGQKSGRYEVDLGYTYAYRDSFLAGFERERPAVEVSDNGAFIVLKDATLHPAGNPSLALNFSQLAVFVDQVAGFSLDVEQDWQRGAAGE